MPEVRIPVAVLGATGTVGQRIVQLLESHPLFEVGELVASERSAGRTYATTECWRLASPLPEAAARMRVKGLEEPVQSAIVLSALPTEVAGPVESRLAAAGHVVCSNAGAHRMDPGVPLLIPEVNPGHLAALERQRRNGLSGYLVANPNCSVIGLLIALKPLSDAFGLTGASVTTMQALSGAGYPGVASLDALDNVVPHIPGEERKMELEARKILGGWDGDAFVDAEVMVSATCTRVPVSDGHLESVSLGLHGSPPLREVAAALRDFTPEVAALRLPSAPRPTIVLSETEDRPQPRLDRDNGRGMAVTVGRLRVCPVLGYKLVVLSHNTIRGAAGAAILNAELLHARGLLDR